MEENNENLTPYQKILLSNRETYHKLYHGNEEFRTRIIERNKAIVYDKYHNDPEYRQKVIDRAKERYHRLKKSNIPED